MWHVCKSTCVCVWKQFSPCVWQALVKEKMHSISSSVRSIFSWLKLWARTAAKKVPSSHQSNDKAPPTNFVQLHAPSSLNLALNNAFHLFFGAQIATLNCHDSTAAMTLQRQRGGLRGGLRGALRGHEGCPPFPPPWRVEALKGGLKGEA